MASEVLIGTIPVFPSAADPRPMTIGGEIARSLDGTGYQKSVGIKVKLSLAWDAITEMELQDVRVIWTQALSNPPTITCSDPYVSGTFLMATKEWPFKPIDGDEGLYSGAIVFEER